MREIKNAIDETHVSIKSLEEQAARKLVDDLNRWQGDKEDIKKYQQVYKTLQQQVTFLANEIEPKVEIEAMAFNKIEQQMKELSQSLKSWSRMSKAIEENGCDLPTYIRSGCMDLSQLHRDVNEIKINQNYIETNIEMLQDFIKDRRFMEKEFEEISLMDAYISRYGNKPGEIIEPLGSKTTHAYFRCEALIVNEATGTVYLKNKMTSKVIKVRDAQLKKAETNISTDDCDSHREYHVYYRSRQGNESITITGITRQPRRPGRGGI